MIRLRCDEDLMRVFPLMKQLRTHLKDEREFIDRVREGEERAGYVLFGLEDSGNMVALCGVQPFVTLYYDHCLWVCDLVTDAENRSKGYGERLLSDVEAWARDNGYKQIALSSGVQRKDAHRFYLDKAHYDMVSYQFAKKL